MTLSNSDLAPAFVVFISFYAITFIVIVYTLWYWRTKGQARVTANESKMQVVREMVDGLLIVGHTKPRNIARQRVRSRYIIWAIVCCSLIYLVLYLAMVNIIYLVLPLLAENNRQLINNAISLILPLIAIWIILPLIRRWIILSFPERKMTDWEQWLWSATQTVLWCALISEGIAILFIVGFTYSWQSATLMFFVYAFVSLATFASFGKSILIFPYYWVQTALARTNYREALRRARHLEVKFSENENHWIMLNRGNALLFAGQYIEAEEAFRQSLQEWNYYNILLPQALTNLGYAFLHQGRYPEATRAFQGALKLDPKAGHAVAGSAEVYLFQRIQTQHALDIIIEYLHKVLAGRLTDRTIWGAVLGDEAWAFAMLGQQAKAEASLEDAFQRMDRSFKPGLAGLHYRSGQVYKRNKRARAVKDFERAIELDPEGSWGQLARQALQELGHTPQTPIAQ